MKEIYMCELCQALATDKEAANACEASHRQLKTAVVMAYRYPQSAQLHGDPPVRENLHTGYLGEVPDFIVLRFSDESTDYCPYVAMSRKQLAALAINRLPDEAKRNLKAGFLPLTFLDWPAEALARWEAVKVEVQEAAGLKLEASTELGLKLAFLIGHGMTVANALEVAGQEDQGRK